MEARSEEATRERAGRRRYHREDDRPSQIVAQRPGMKDERELETRAGETTPGGAPSSDLGHMLAVGLTGYFAFLDVYITQPLLPLLSRQYRASELAVSLTISAVTLAIALAAPLTGLLADRVGRKRVIVGGMLALAAPTILASQASSLASLVHWRFLQGLFVPAIFVVTIAYVTEEWKAKRAALAMSVYVVGTVLGGVSGRFFAGLITARWGWRAAFAALGLLTILGAALTWKWLPGARRFARAADWRSTLRAAAGHLRNPRLLATFAIGFNLLFALVAAFTYVVFELAAPPFHLGAAALGMVYFAYLPSLLFLPRAGRWTGRVGHRKALVAALAVTAAGTLLTLWPRLAPILAGLALCSGGLFAAQAAATGYLGIEARQARSSAAGLYASLYYVGGSLGGILPGIFWARFHWLACVALMLIAEALAVALAFRFWQARMPAAPAAGAVPEAV
ncbi:MAG: MFS transporter [Terriglobales bacterium]